MCDAEARSEALAALDKELNTYHRFIEMLPAEALNLPDDDDETSAMEHLNTARGPSERTLRILSSASSLSCDASTAKLDTATTSESHESITSKSGESGTKTTTSIYSSSGSNNILQIVLRTLMKKTYNNQFTFYHFNMCYDKIEGKLLYLKIRNKISISV